MNNRKNTTEHRAAARACAAAAVALYRAGFHTQAKAIWTASMESFK